MSMEIADKSDLKYVSNAVDILRENSRTSGLDVKSLRILEYDEFLSDRTGYEFKTRIQLGFTVGGEPHEAEFIINTTLGALFSRRLSLTYAVLDGHYDLLANKEIW